MKRRNKIVLIIILALSVIVFAGLEYHLAASWPRSVNVIR